MDFLLYLYKEKEEEWLREVWLNKEINMEFEEFLDTALKTKKEIKKLSKDEAEENIRKAEAILGRR